MEFFLKTLPCFHPSGKSSFILDLNFPTCGNCFYNEYQQNIVYVMLFHVQFGNLVFYQGGMREQMEAQMYRKQAFTIDFANFFNVQ
jgi:hypothetical protein